MWIPVPQAGEWNCEHLYLRAAMENISVNDMGCHEERRHNNLLGGRGAECEHYWNEERRRFQGGSKAVARQCLVEKVSVSN